MYCHRKFKHRPTLRIGDCDSPGVTGYVELKASKIHLRGLAAVAATLVSSNDPSHGSSGPSDDCVGGGLMKPVGFEELAGEDRSLLEVIDVQGRGEVRQLAQRRGLPVCLET